MRFAYVFSVSAFGLFSHHVSPAHVIPHGLSPVSSRGPEAVPVGELPLERAEGHPHPDAPEQGGRGHVHPARQHQVRLRLLLRLRVRQRWRVTTMWCHASSYFSGFSRSTRGDGLLNLSDRWRVTGKARLIRTLNIHYGVCNRTNNVQYRQNQEGKTIIKQPHVWMWNSEG